METEPTPERAATPGVMRPLDGRARFAVVTLAFVIAAAAAILWSTLGVVAHAKHVTDGAVVATAGDAPYTRFAVTLVLSVGVGLVGGAAFLVWFYRAHANARRAGARLRYRSYWTFLGFIVPLLNCVRPYAVMREVSTASSLLGDGEHAGGEAPVARPDGRIVWWWVCTLAAVTAVTGAQLAARVAAGTADSGSATAVLIATASAFVIAGSVLAIGIVGRITTQQRLARYRAGI